MAVDNTDGEHCTDSTESIRRACDRPTVDSTITDGENCKENKHGFGRFCYRGILEPLLSCQKICPRFQRQSEGHQCRMPLVVYNLGFFPTEHQELKSKFPWAHVRKFNFSHYPPFFNITVDKGQYAWKAAILHEVYLDYGAAVIWMDASNQYSSVSNIVDNARKGQFMSNWAGHRVRAFVHNGTWQYLTNRFGTKEDWRKRIEWEASCSGAFLAFGVQNPKVVHMLQLFYECSLEKQCIAPEGSNRRNHRQDQVVVSILAHHLGLGKSCSLTGGLGVRERRTDIPPVVPGHEKMLKEFPELKHTMSCGRC